MYLFFVLLILELLTMGILLNFIPVKPLKAFIALFLLIVNALIARYFFRKIIPGVYEKYKETNGNN